MSNTPTLDKFRLHPMGGYCTCFSKPWAVCSICTAVEALQERWKNLSPENRKKAIKESEEAYPRTSNQDGR